ncbi:MAG: radical SAM protein [Alistipes sp.]|nr:radical SAM protein [Candidatus Minthomonas equi]
MNDGGVTFTGGEPTMQAEFMINVLKRLDGIHKAVETSGFCSAKVFADILEHIDYVLFDLKIIDSEEHRRWTGADNTQIIANFRSLKASGKPFVVRIPLIPGVSDSERNLHATYSLISEDSPAGLQRVEILRYHKTAGSKYAAVGMEYSPGFDTEAIPDPHIEIFEGLNVLVL